MTGGITGLSGGTAGLLAALHSRRERAGRARMYPELRAVLAELGPEIYDLGAPELFQRL
ncbi:hypothetical protein [Streptomyces sp. 2A115]|uniref:hypothetical protein n=1 Tax=Streptomyces sp. 2A115 TaxID=3457439 RepID=UPI003FD1CAFB